MTLSRDQVMKANRLVHASLADSGEYEKSPHFRPENQAKVRQVLESLAVELPTPRRLLDLGCGTGFIIALAHDLFAEVHGVDITDEMTRKVDLSPGNIELTNAPAESLPFADGHFDMVSAYSFLDHLLNYEPVLAEAVRVLRPGGIFYADLNPNIHFSSTMHEMEKLSSLPPVVAREVEGMLHNGAYYEQNFQIDASTLTAAEPIKSFDGGFDAEAVAACATRLGFSQCEHRYDWYLGQATLLHERPEGDAALVEEYLRFCLPASRTLFKYLRFVFRK